MQAVPLAHHVALNKLPNLFVFICVSASSFTSIDHKTPNLSPACCENSSACAGSLGVVLGRVDPSDNPELLVTASVSSVGLGETFSKSLRAASSGKNAPQMLHLQSVFSCQRRSEGGTKGFVWAWVWSPRTRLPQGKPGPFCDPRLSPPDLVRLSWKTRTQPAEQRPVRNGGSTQGPGPGAQPPKEKPCA